jgi:protein-tyrosine-phosphatase
MPPATKYRVLFVCLGNACRSPMAEAIARHMASDIIESSSAGLMPLGHIAKATEQTLLASGYPVKGLSSKPLSRGAVEHADVIINMSGRPLDKFMPKGRAPGDPPRAKKVEAWNVEDPYGEDPATFHKILQELESRVLLLAAQLRTGRVPAKS